MAPRVTLGYTADARVHRDSGVPECFWCTAGRTGARGGCAGVCGREGCERGVALAHQQAARTSAGNQATSGKWHRFRLVAPVCGCHLSVAVPVCGRDAGNGTAREKGGRCAVRWGCARLGCARGLGVQLAGCAGDAARRSGTPRMLGYTAVAVSLRVLGVPQWQKGCRVRALAGKSASGMRAGQREAAKCRNAANKR